jgi:hypothetical protein
MSGGSGGNPLLLAEALGEGELEELIDLTWLSDIW